MYVVNQAYTCKSIITPHYRDLTVYKHSALRCYALSCIMHVYMADPSRGIITNTYGIGLEVLG